MASSSRPPKRSKSTRPPPRPLHTPPPPSSPPKFWQKGTPDNPDNFDFETHFDQIKGKPTQPGRKVKFSGFSLHNFHIHADKMGWRDFLVIKEPYYPTLMPYFYANLRKIDDDALITLVKGRKIKITRKLISDLFHAPNEGPNIYFSTLDEIDEDFDLSILYRPNRPNNSRTNNMTYEARMAHNVIAHNVATKMGSMDQMTDYASIVVYLFVKDIRFNLADYIFHRMFDEALGHFPFGMAITRILRRFKVDLSNEKEGTRGKSFNLKTLSLMSIPFDHASESDTSGDKAPRRPSGPSSSRPSSSTQAPPSPPRRSTASYEEEIALLRATHANITDQLTTQAASQARLETIVHAHIAHQNEENSKFKKYFKKLMRKMNCSPTTSDEA